MGRRKSAGTDPQWLTERAYRNNEDAGPVVAADDFRAQKVLAGVGATYGHIEGRPCTQAARFIITKNVYAGRANEDTEELLDALGLDWDDASPVPGDYPVPERDLAEQPEAEWPEGAWADAKDCTRCRRPKPLAAFPADAAKSDGRHSRCTECQAEVDAARKPKPKAKPSRRRARPKKTPAKIRCCTCREVKDNTEFGLNSATPTGLSRQCKPCKNALSNTYRAEKRRYSR